MSSGNEISIGAQCVTTNVELPSRASPVDGTGAKTSVSRPAHTRSAVERRDAHRGRDVIDLGTEPAVDAVARSAEGLGAAVDLIQSLLPAAEGPPGLRGIRAAWLEELERHSLALSAVSATYGVLGALSSADPGTESVKVTLRTVVTELAHKAAKRAVAVARNEGATAFAGSARTTGWLAGEMAATGIEEIVQGFVEVDPARWNGAQDFDARLRQNSTIGRETYLRLRREGRTVPTALTLGMWRTLGADLRAFVRGSP